MSIRIDLPVFASGDEKPLHAVKGSAGLTLSAWIWRDDQSTQALS
jgi:hypothetical protein